MAQSTALWAHAPGETSHFPKAEHVSLLSHLLPQVHRANYELFVLIALTSSHKDLFFIRKAQS